MLYDLKFFFLDLMPNNKFHCGRLVIKKNGDVKKLTAQRGGGIRYCEISHIDMGFEEIHDRLREIFLSGYIKE
jgi:hypothetical protein